MTWLVIIALTIAAMLVAVFGLRLPRAGWTLLGATLLFGLAGYAAQGSPSQPSSPTATRAEAAVNGELLVSARREFFSASQLPSRWVVTGDGFARRSDFARAASFYRSAVRENSRDVEAWLALGIALIEHAEGRVTPAAIHALERAGKLAPTNGAPRYFLGLAWLRAGEPVRTHQLWTEALAAAPKDAEWRAALQMRIERLDALMEAMAKGQRPAN